MLSIDQCHRCTIRAIQAFPGHSFSSRKSLKLHTTAPCLQQCVIFQGSEVGQDWRQARRRATVPLVAHAQQHTACPKSPASDQQCCDSASWTSGPNDLWIRASSQLKAPALVAGALLPLLQQRWALAEDLESTDTGSAAPTDYLITGIFAIVILALTIVTVGVLYLSLTSFLDKRAEEEDKKKFEEAQRDRDLQALGIKRPKRKRAEDELTRGGGKGFGG